MDVWRREKDQGWGGHAANTPLHTNSILCMLYHKYGNTQPALHYMQQPYIDTRGDGV